MDKPTFPFQLSRRAAFLSAGTLGLLALALPVRAAERSETRSLPAFDALRLRGAIDVVVRQGPASVEVRGDDELVKAVETRVVESGGRQVLEVRLKDAVSLGFGRRVVVTAGAPAWQSLALDGAGELQADGLRADRLVLALSGSGDMRLRGLQAQAVELAMTGSGDVRLAGTAKRFGVALKGSGDVWAEDLVADDVDVAVAGSGDVRVHALQSLQAAVAGSGDIEYRGAPRLALRISGSGTVTRR